ncbi:hypothetical protein H0N96_00450 [Candidatus Micrarchaeota archaeon]|nr:hypothetical protein [Candidatus Micrarchaeota archaeon]
MLLIALIIAASVVLAFFAGFEAKTAFSQGGNELSFAPGEKTRVETKLPAVDKQGRGALADLIVEASDASGGSGSVFIEIKDGSPLINPDTQTSLRNAIEAARGAGAGVDGKNLYYSIRANSDVVGGGSAGAALAVATMAAVEGKRLRSDALVTGGIDASGSITRVGGIIEKARAVKQAGYSLFLVPVGEAKQQVPVESCREQRSGNSAFRECTTSFEEKDVGVESGIKIVEVASVSQAFELMISASG